MDTNIKKECFLWGVATSAFQLEGSPYADWASWDSILDLKPEVTNHFQLYKEDLNLLKELGVNSYRFSLEWSRIQPKQNYWDEKALDHYQEIIDILLANSIEPMVTIHHFTHPLWFIKKYPWHKDTSIDKFVEYTEKLTSKVRGIKYWITFNEPYVLILGGYLEGCMPPAIKDLSLALKALKNILISHAKAYDIIHSKVPNAMVSVAHNMAALAPWKQWNPFDRLLAKIAKYFYNHSLLDAFLTGKLTVKIPFKKAQEIEVPIKDKIDFFGVNYYTRIHIRFNPFRKLGVELRHRDIDGHGLTDMGWEIHPQGLERVIRYASKLKKPLIITENGIATHDNQKKIKFMKHHIDVLERCIKKGYDVRGYFYWSLIDNYEWLQGLDARFGLYRVDFDTLKRKPTSAASYYSYIIKSRNFQLKKN
ncbi:MAG: glycoside hydrolase family 1 protein [Thermodesulfovibrionales bacterium]|nr:glycoside hydrolase family 1 protein [Thermodesulfovibrionales bacterium]